MEKPRRKNITFSLPEDLIRQAKIYAAKKGTSVNAIVQESLAKVVTADDRHAEAVKRIMASTAKYRLRSRNLRWTREDLYA